MVHLLKGLCHEMFGLICLLVWIKSQIAASRGPLSCCIAASEDEYTPAATLLPLEDLSDAALLPCWRATQQGNNKPGKPDCNLAT